MWHLPYIQFYNYGGCDCDPCYINIHVLDLILIMAFVMALKNQPSNWLFKN